MRLKKAEMSMALIVAIVIGLVIMAIVIYMVWGKSKNLSEATGCTQDLCKKSDTECKAIGKVISYNPCKYTDDTTKKLTTGRCCVDEPT